MRTCLSYLNNLIFPLIPESHGFGLKRFLLRLAGAKIGCNVKISSSLKVYGAGELIIGENTWIGYQVTIVTSSRVEIGRNVDIAPKVYIGTGSHTIDPTATRIAAADISKDVTISDGCWLCACATILPGTIIGKMNVVAAGAVVTHPFCETGILIAGVPATKKKQL